jgi:hypothetical protein
MALAHLCHGMNLSLGVANCALVRHVLTLLSVDDECGEDGKDFVITGTNLKFERGGGYAFITETLDTDADAVPGSDISYCISKALHAMISDDHVRGLQHPGIELSMEGEQ